MNDSNLSRMVARWSHFSRRVRAFLGKGWVIERTPIQISFDQSRQSESPIFVIGTNRSGTSLVRRILDSHSVIACPPETFFLAHYAKLITDDNAMIGLKSMGISHTDALSVVRNQASFFHHTYQLAKEKKRWADKTPQYAFVLDGIERIFGPSSLYVWVRRNPLDVAYSLWNRGWRMKSFGEDSLADVCLFVRDSWKKQRSFFEELDSERFMIIRYEDLVADSERIVQSLMTFIGEQFEPQILRFWEVHHDFGTEDPIVRGTKGFQISEGSWKGWDSRSQNRARSLLKEVMRESGYENEFNGLNSSL